MMGDNCIDDHHRDDNHISDNNRPNAIDDLDGGDSDFDENAHRVYATHRITTAQVGQRLDKVASQVFDGFSRASLQKMITSGELCVNGRQVKAKYSVAQGDELCLDTVLAPLCDLPENIALDKVFEDDSVLIINKPKGLVVHPGAGNRTGTLVNALLYHYPNQAHLPRAGLVHRIDKDTTGLLLIAKTAKAQLALIDQLKDKQVYRHYQCVVVGTKDELGRHRVIDAPIARHPTHRTKMACRSTGKPAVTHIKACRGLGAYHCLLDVVLETGRTHQIRVHLTSLGHSLVGDKVYTTNKNPPLSPDKKQAIEALDGQALHAYQLGFIHPNTGESLVVTKALPAPMQRLIEILDD